MLCTAGKPLVGVSIQVTREAMSARPAHHLYLVPRASIQEAAAGGPAAPAGPSLSVLVTITTFCAVYSKEYKNTYLLRTVYTLFTRVQYLLTAVLHSLAAARSTHRSSSPSTRHNTLVHRQVLVSIRIYIYFVLLRIETCIYEYLLVQVQIVVVVVVSLQRFSEEGMIITSSCVWCMA